MWLKFILNVCQLNNAVLKIEEEIKVKFCQNYKNVND